MISPPFYSGVSQMTKSLILDRTATSALLGAERCCFSGCTVKSTIDEWLQKLPFNNKTLIERGNLPLRSGIIHVFRIPPSLTVSTSTVEELPLRVPHVTLMDGNEIHVSTHSNGKSLMCVENIIFQRCPNRRVGSSFGYWVVTLDTIISSLVHIGSSTTFISSAVV
jgi:hypothetical protein